MLTQILNVQVSRIGLFPIIDAVQGDSGRVLECRLTDFVIPSGSTARIYAQKPSGAQIYNNAMVDGNVVSVDLTTQILAEVGKVVCQIEVDNGGERVTSFDFALNVVKSRVDGSAIESEDEFTVLEDAIDDAQEATTAANSAANAANAAASTANAAANGANTAAGAASTAASTANSAASNADAAREEIEQKLAAGDFNASIAVGSTTTGEPGTDASVNNSGTNMDVVLDFVIPKGEKGDPGDIENISQQSITFTEAQSVADIVSGSTLAVLFGQILKNQNDFLDADTIQAAQNAGILSEGGSTLLNEILQLYLANAVTEEYDDGIWHVKKYVNGEAEIRGTFLTSKNYSITTGYGSLFMFNPFAISLPIQLVDPEKSQAAISISSKGGDFAGCVRFTNDGQYTNVSFAWFNATAYEATAGARIQYIVKGKWK